jgi:glycosyltransferase involved in cell wall biosynthesis
MKSSVFFFGRFPAYKEVGGVTTFTYNFAMKFKEENLQVIDFYPAREKKIPDGVSYKLIGGNIVLRLVKMFLFCLKNKGHYMFNFSSIRSLLFMAILPKRASTKWVAIFHNGEQEKNYNRMGCIERMILRTCFKKIDVVGYLSQKQLDFFKKFNVSDLQRVSPYISRPIKVAEKNNDEKIETVPNILITGFPTKIYRLVETIDMLNKLTDLGCIFNLNVCLYGFDNEGLRTEIIDKISNYKHIYLHEHLDENEFDHLLNSTDIYLRLNSVDSFGLVVAEAIEKGVIVISTDVCERYPGSLLVKKDDFTSVSNEVYYIIKNKQVSGKLAIQVEPTGIVSYKELLNSL